MRHLGLFEGIGGFSLAAHWMGWETVAWVEIDKRCQALLKQHFPNAKGHGDINRFDGTEYRGTIDILTGGFPCQTFSLAGKGATDLTLWKEMFRVIREVGPKVVVAENVYGILARKKGMALSVVYDDLESEGYTTMPALIIPACAAGAFHRRDRVWIVAYSSEFRNWQLPVQQWREREEDTNTDWQNKESVSDIESTGLPSGGVRFRDEKKQPESNYHFRASDWSPWATEPLVGGRLHGISERVDRVKELGNAIYPPVAYEIFKAIDQVMRGVREST